MVTGCGLRKSGIRVRETSPIRSGDETNPIEANQSQRKTALAEQKAWNVRFQHGSPVTKRTHCERAIARRGGVARRRRVS